MGWLVSRVLRWAWGLGQGSPRDVQSGVSIHLLVLHLPVSPGASGLPSSAECPACVGQVL